MPFLSVASPSKTVSHNMQAHCEEAPTATYTPTLRAVKFGQCVLTVGDVNVLVWGNSGAALHVWVHGLYIRAPPQGVQTSLQWANFWTPDLGLPEPRLWLTDVSAQGGTGWFTAHPVFAAGAHTVSRPYIRHQCADAVARKAL